MAETPAAYIVHETPMRLRLRIPEKRNDKAYFTTTLHRLQNIPGVEAEVNPATSSILLRGAQAGKAVIELGAQAPFNIMRSQPEAGLGLEQLRKQLQTANEGFTRLTGGDARALVVLALAISGVMQLARGNVVAPAVTLLWYAAEALRCWTPRAEQKPPDGAPL
jgi:hypothetical protein